MVSFLERIFCTTERISFFSTRKLQRLSNSLSISSISLRSFLSFSFYSLVNCFIISSQNTSARHPEAPRISTHEASSRVWRTLASIFGISTSSHEGFYTPIFFCYIHTMHSVGGRNSAGLGLLPGLCLFSSSRVWRKRRFIALYGRDLCQEDWATPEPKVCGHPLCCSFPILSTPSLVGLATIPCTLPSYLPAVYLREGNIAFSAAVSQINKLSYSGNTSSKVFCINSSAVSSESLLLWQRTAIQAPWKALAHRHEQKRDCMYVCKSLFKHGKSSVKLKLKTKTNYNCFT